MWTYDDISHKYTTFEGNAVHPLDGRLTCGYILAEQVTLGVWHVWHSERPDCALLYTTPEDPSAPVDGPHKCYTVHSLQYCDRKIKVIGHNVFNIRNTFARLLDRAITWQDLSVGIAGPKCVVMAWIADNRNTLRHRPVGYVHDTRKVYRPA